MRNSNGYFAAALSFALSAVLLAAQAPVANAQEDTTPDAQQIEGTPETQETDQTQEQQPADAVAQMPVAVSKLEKAGVPEEVVNRVSSALQRGEVDPATFNETMRNLPQMAEEMNGFNGVGEFVETQVENGLRGEQLSQAIHQELQAQGIPAGGAETDPPPPAARNFLPEDAQQSIEEQTQDEPTTESLPQNHQLGASSLPDRSADAAAGRRGPAQNAPGPAEARRNTPESVGPGDNTPDSVNPPQNTPDPANSGQRGPAGGGPGRPDQISPGAPGAAGPNQNVPGRGPGAAGPSGNPGR